MTTVTRSLTKQSDKRVQRIRESTAGAHRALCERSEMHR